MSYHDGPPGGEALVEFAGWAIALFFIARFGLLFLQQMADYFAS